MMTEKKPPWLRKRLPPTQDLLKVKKILQQGHLHTVCEEARCPNLGECFSHGTATFLIMGRICTRNCSFCAVEHGQPAFLDEAEPERVAQAVEQMGLRYVVLTSVSRDDLPHGGASHFARTIRAIRALNPDVKVEVLIPDFQGELASLEKVLGEHPEVLNHNVETVERLYPLVRPQANYQRSLDLLRRSKAIDPGAFTKSGLMLGLGEERGEVMQLMEDLRRVGCDFLTVGQYLQPRRDRLPVMRYIPPDEFDEYKKAGKEMGFKSVASGPFVRSSFRASQMLEASLD